MMPKRKDYAPLLVLVALVCISGCATNVRLYEPKNPDEALIKQLFVDQQEGLRKKDETLILPYIDKDIEWYGKHSLFGKEAFAASLRRDFKKARYRHQDASFSDMKITFEGETMATVIVYHNSKEVQWVIGEPIIMQFKLKKIGDGQNKWVIYYKMSIPKQLKKYYIKE